MVVVVIVVLARVLILGRLARLLGGDLVNDNDNDNDNDNNNNNNVNNNITIISIIDNVTITME